MSSSDTTSKDQLTQKRERSPEDGTERTKRPTFEDFDDVFSYYTNLSEFCVGGEIALHPNSSKLFYQSSYGSAEYINFLNIYEQDINTLAANCSLSPFGMGGKSVVDPKVRQAKELKATNFSFQFSPQTCSGITSHIQQLLGGREFIIKPYKLNIYPKGGHFKRHKETLQNDKMIASLVICLPTPFKGGVLTVENEKGLSVNFDWGKEISQKFRTFKKIRWACFFCSCDHSISPVTKGNRITIAYAIFRKDSIQNIPDGKTKPTTEYLHENCSADLHDLVKKLDVKVKYGYFPNHMYGLGVTDATNKDIRDELKGNDLILFDILKEYGWTVILQLCYPGLQLYGPFISEDFEEVWELKYDKNNIFKLQKLSTLKLINEMSKCNKQKIKKYGIAGNSPPAQAAYIYGGTIMILRHESFSEEDNVEESVDEEEEDDFYGDSYSSSDEESEEEMDEVDAEEEMDELDAEEEEEVDEEEDEW